MCDGLQPGRLLLVVKGSLTHNTTSPYPKTHTHTHTPTPRRARSPSQPRSIFGMLLCRGQPKPLQFRYGQGYKDPYGRSFTPGTSKNLLMDSTVGVSGRPTLNAKGAPKSYPKGKGEGEGEGRG